MVTLDFIHIIALFALMIAMYGKLFMEIMENNREINDLKARLRECERRWEEYDRQSDS